MAVQSQELRILVRALADPSVQVVAREMVVFLRQMQGNLRALSREAQSTGSAFGNMAQGIIGFLRDVAATAAGVLVRDVIVGSFQRLKEAIREAQRALIDANAVFEQYVTTITVMAGSQEKANLYLEVMRRLAQETGRSMSEMVQMGQPFVRFAEGSSLALEKLMKAAMMLQALKPQAGPLAAMIAITEALSGQFRSLQYRFEISKDRIQAVLDEGYVGVEALIEVLRREGATWDLVTAQANTFLGALTTIKGVAADFFRLLGQGIFKELRDDLISVRDWLRANEEAIFGLAQAIGSYLADAYRTVRDLLADLIGVEAISLEDVVQWGASFVASLVDGILYGVDRYLMPALISVASIIASFLAGHSPPERGPLSDIDVGGEKMLEAYVEGILRSDAPQRVKEVAEEIRRELAQGERLAALRRAVAEAQRQGAALVEAAQRRVAAAQREVEEATRRVQEAQERLNEFTRRTAEIPERFTRARRRQLEEELRAAQREQREKQDALRAAQEALRAAQEQARAMAEAARERERAIREQMQLENRRLRLLERLKEAQEEAEGAGFGAGITGDIEQADSKISAYAEKWKGMFAEAFAGHDIQGRVASIAEKFESLKESAQVIGDNAWKIADFFRQAADFVDRLVQGFNNLPPWVQDILKGAAIVLAINVATGGLVNSLLAALVPLGLKAGPLGWAVMILATLVITNREELQRWNPFAAAQQGMESRWVQAGVLLKMGLDPEVNKRIAEQTGQSVGQQFWEGLKERVNQILGVEAPATVEQAAQAGLRDPILSVAQETRMELVGQSIIPEMVDEVIGQYRRMAEDATELAQTFSREVIAAVQEMADEMRDEIRSAARWVETYTTRMNSDFGHLTDTIRLLRLEIERLVAALRSLPGIGAGTVPLPSAQYGAQITRTGLVLAHAGELIGRPEQLAGIVAHFDQRGWQIGPGVDGEMFRRIARQEFEAGMDGLVRDLKKR